MKSILSFFSLTILGGMLLSGCFLGDIIDCESPSGTQITQTYTVGAFDEIDIATSADVNITQGPQLDIVVTGSDNIVNAIEILVVGNELKIGKDECVISSDVVIDIQVPDLNAINVLGSGNVLIDSTFTTQDLALKISGSGDMDLDLDVASVGLEIVGSGNVKLEGQATDVEAEISGSGDVMAFDLAAQNADLEIRGSGDMEVNLSGNLEGKISGSGTIYYKGSPSINVEILGSGEIVDAN